MMQPTKNAKGFTLVEVLVGSAILMLVFVAFSSSLSLFAKASERATERTQALFLAEEGIEVVRGLRDAGWSSNIASQSLDTPLGLTFDGTSWSIVSSPQVTNGFERSVEFESVYRDADDDIASTGTLDEAARRVVVEVSWDEGNNAVELKTLLTDLFEN